MRKRYFDVNCAYHHLYFHLLKNELRIETLCIGNSNVTFARIRLWHRNRSTAISYYTQTSPDLLSARYDLSPQQLTKNVRNLIFSCRFATLHSINRLTCHRISNVNTQTKKHFIVRIAKRVSSKVVNLTPIFGWCIGNRNESNAASAHVILPQRNIFRSTSYRSI